MLPLKLVMKSVVRGNTLVADAIVRNCGLPTSWKVYWSLNGTPATPGPVWLNAPVAEVGLTPRLATMAALAGDAASPSKATPASSSLRIISLLIRDWTFWVRRRTQLSQFFEFTRAQVFNQTQT